MSELLTEQVRQLDIANENQMQAIEVLRIEMKKWKHATKQKIQQIPVLTDLCEDKRRL